MFDGPKGCDQVLHPEFLELHVGEQERREVQVGLPAIGVWEVQDLSARGGRYVL